MEGEPELSATNTWCSGKYGLNTCIHEMGFEAGSLTAQQPSVDAKSLTYSAISVSSHMDVPVSRPNERTMSKRKPIYQD
jgi:hypothetical protein